MNNGERYYHYILCKFLESHISHTYIITYTKCGNINKLDFVCFVILFPNDPNHCNIEKKIRFILKHLIRCVNLSCYISILFLFFQVTYFDVYN
jgi:hypothetical protein